MNRRTAEWLPRPDSDDDDAPNTEQRMDFRVAGEWFTVDSDQLVMPIYVIEKTGIEAGEGYPALLKQYGGEKLLNDLLLADEPLEQGSTWRMIRYENRLTVDPLGDD